MNLQEFESWLNAVENVCGDYSQAEARSVLVKDFSESKQREIADADQKNYLQEENQELIARVKTLEDALKSIACTNSPWTKGYMNMAKQALATREPK